MRVLFIANDFPSPLNPTKAVFNMNLARALSRRHEVQVVCPIPWMEEWAARKTAQKLPGNRREVIDGIEIHYPRYLYPPKLLRSYYGWFYWRSIRGVVSSILRSNRPDAILSYWAHPDGEAAMRAGWHAGAPSAVIVGGSDVLLITANRRRQRCVARVLNGVDGVITVNEHLRQKVRELGISENRIRVWSQGIDERIFFPGDRAAARQLLGIKHEGPLLLWVGRMAPVKGLEILLQAAALLKQQQSNFKLYLVGGGPLRAGLEADCARLGIADMVVFAGSQQPEKLGDWYRAANLFVMSSWSEGLPNVLRESLACGTPFVASNVGGIAEIAGSVNRLFPAGDATAMADAIAASLDQAMDPREFHRATTWSESADAMLEILSSLRPKPHASFADKDRGQGSVDSNGAPMQHAEVGAWWRPRQIFRRALAVALPHRRFIVSGPQRSRQVCLTFDDGPDPRHTAAVLDTLGEHNVKATFFVVGQRAEEHPDLLRRIVAEGHALGHHSYDHADPEMTSAQALIKGVRRTDEILRGVASRRVTLFRPPHGKVTVAKLIASWREGLSIVLWNRDPKDFTGEDAGELRERLLGNPLRSGDIVLLHDNVERTAHVLGDVVRATRQSGLEFTTVDRWVNSTPAATS